MKSFFRTLTSTWLMGCLFILLAAVMAMATFIENDYGTHAAKALVYNTRWFELIFFLLAVNMVGNILSYKLWTKSKFPVFLFHFSFFVILAGAAITRYVGYEGLLHIREGEQENTMLSMDPYVTAEFTSGGQTDRVSRQVFVSPASPKEFNARLQAGDEQVRVKSVAFVPNAVSQPVEVSDGNPVAAVVFSGGMQREELFMQPGDTVKRAGLKVAFEPLKSLDADIIIRRSTDGNSLELASSQSFSGFNMEHGQRHQLNNEQFHPLHPGVLYDFNELRVTISRYYPSARIQPVSLPGERDSGLPGAVVFDVLYNNEKHQLAAYGWSSNPGEPYSLQLPGGNLSVRYGALPITLPFSIHLKEFTLERYPGSQSPSGYVSDVTLTDDERGVKKDYSVFMNNILNYRGFRLYQSSYDQDEKGTILSVNHDRWGTLITYFGYFIMSLGMLWALFARNTRFRKLMQKVDKIHQQRKLLTVSALFIMSSLAFQANANPQLPPVTDAQIAKEFGSLWVQSNDGRVKPLNSLHQEIALKLVKHHTFRGMNADQLILGMLVHPAKWQSFPLITVKDPQIKTILGITADKAAFSDFFDGQRHYKLHQWADAAHRQNPAARNKTEQEIIKIDEQVNVFYLTQMGNLHKMFPSSKEIDLPWYTPTSTPETLSSSDSLFVTASLREFIGLVRQGDKEKALSQLQKIDDYQSQYASEILPSDRMKKTELLYNRLSIFLWLATWFFGLGIILILFQFVSLLSPKLNLKWFFRIGYVLLFAGFLYHTFGLILRWIIAGHAPWSNGYESMIFVGWAILFAGFVMARKSNMVLPITGLFTGIVLMVAHLSWMNPHITNLVPVLQSYWLTLHVSVIIGGYGFMALGALLGFLNLVLITLRNSNNIKRLQLTVDELSAINEMSLTVGLYLMTIGSFLGGVWANESWGRYWGWDPKETWSLITIILYAFVLHLRLIPGLKGVFAFNTASLISFGSVIMTYLGVNYYLSGLHSYAGGDPVPIPSFVWYSAGVILVVILLARWNEMRMKKDKI